VLLKGNLALLKCIKKHELLRDSISFTRRAKHDD
jgi:hypothetical protein